MKLLDKLERKFGKYAIPHLILYVLGFYIIGYILYYMAPGAYQLLELNPALVCKGQVWRLVTWVCTIPQQLNIFIIFMFTFYYFIGNSLENAWGTFRYNLYMVSGMIIMTVGTMLVYFLTGFFMGFEHALSIPATTYYVNLVSFFAFATLFPEMKIMLMGLIPIKIKWLAYLDAAILVIDFLKAGLYRDFPAYAWGIRLSILFSVGNFLIFFFATRDYRKLRPKELKRKHNYKKQVRNAKTSAGHRCDVCGVTDEQDPTMVFRYCSKCVGNHEYCQNHLFTHTHIK